MKIVVIGAGGQLGSDCCRLFAGEHHTVGCDFPAIDIASPASVNSFFEQEQPEVIINCAAYTAVDGCESQAALAWQVNAEGPGHLARAAERLGCRIIHISTDYIFDGTRPAGEAYLENDLPNPLSEYGRSKLAGEQAVIAHASNHLILRTAWLYSAWGGNFLKTILRLALADPERELKVVNDQFGSLTWSLTLARQIRPLLSSDLQGIAHATAEGYSTWYEGARAFLDEMAVPYRMRPCTTAEYPTPAHRPANSILENQVLKRSGLALFVDWREDLTSFVREHRDRLLAENQPK